MSKKMEIVVRIKDEDGTEIVRGESEREVPYIGEIEASGFRAAFHELEGAVLEGQREAGKRAVGEYLEHMAKKKRRR